MILIYFKEIDDNKGYGLMPFTSVIFSTYEFPRESLANAKSAPPFFMFKNALVLKLMTWIGYSLKNKLKDKFKDKYLSNFENIFILKELFFTSPQLKITLFKAVLAQFSLKRCFFKTKLSNNMCLLVQGKINASSF